MSLSVSKIVVLCSLSLTAVAAVGDSDDQNVKVFNVNYSCCNPLAVIPKEGCSQTWSYKDKMIAHIVGSNQKCIPPCQKDGDKLKIRDCVNCTAKNICKNGTFTVEEVFNYEAQPCQHQSIKLDTTGQAQPQTQGHVGLVLVALLIFGFFTNC